MGMDKDEANAVKQVFSDTYNYTHVYYASGYGKEVIPLETLYIAFRARMFTELFDELSKVLAEVKDD